MTMMNDNHTIKMPNNEPTVSLRVGDQMIDIRRLGDILIKAGQAINECFTGADDE